MVQYLPEILFQCIEQPRAFLSIFKVSALTIRRDCPFMLPWWWCGNEKSVVAVQSQRERRGYEQPSPSIPHDKHSEYQRGVPRKVVPRKDPQPSPSASRDPTHPKSHWGDVPRQDRQRSDSRRAPGSRSRRESRGHHGSGVPNQQSRHAQSRLHSSERPIKCVPACLLLM